jgi:hypothetical protein
MLCQLPWQHHVHVRRGPPPTLCGSQQPNTHAAAAPVRALARWRPICAPTLARRLPGVRSRDDNGKYSLYITISYPYSRYKNNLVRSPIYTGGRIWIYPHTISMRIWVTPIRSSVPIKIKQLSKNYTIQIASISI